jgi:H+/gluconate symporter-like permease
MLAVSGILASLCLLMGLAYRNHSVVVIAPLCALVAVVFDGDMPLMATYTQIFMTSLGLFLQRYFPLFLLGSIFGKLMEETGSAAAIAQRTVDFVGSKHAILALVLTCALLTYGGVSLFVVVFTAFPMAIALFRQANLPQRLIPASIALGSFTFTMTALPGSVQIQNLIPMPFFKTTSYAAPRMGLMAAAIMFFGGMVWLTLREKQARERGEGFEIDADSMVQSNDLPPADSNRPSIIIALAPLIFMVISNFVLSQIIVPGWNAGYLAEKRFGSTSLDKVAGTWSTVLAMSGAIVCLIGLHFWNRRKLSESVTRGANASLLPVFNAASEFGYGSTIAALTGFAMVKSWMVAVAPSKPLISEALSVNVLAGITGSASGGLSIALEALGPTFLERGTAASITPEIMHRVASLSCGGLDTLPHNGAVITLLLICGRTHRESYADIAVVSLVVPVLATVTVILMA